MGNISYPCLIRAIAKPVLACILLSLRGKSSSLFNITNIWSAVNRAGMPGLDLSAKIPVTERGLGMEIVLNKGMLPGKWNN